MKRAAIAIGSNSTRMLAAETEKGELRNPIRGREETRLFLGLDEAGNISPDKLEATAQAVKRLHRAAIAYGVESVDLFATSATRDAGNSADFAARIRELTGLELQIISGEEEARLAFMAVSEGKRRLVMDIGGGSTEWTIGEHNRVEWAVSMQLGASRLLKMQPINCPQDAEKALALCREIMAPYERQLSALPSAPGMIGLGGSCTTAAAITMGREAHGESVEGKTVTLRQAMDQLHLLSGMTIEERMRVPGLPPARAMHYPLGLCILITALELCGFDKITISGKINLDGYLLNIDREE